MRAAAGAWHVPAGFAFLLKRPRLWPLAILPAFLAAACLFGGLALGVFAIPYVEGLVLRGPGRLTDVTALVLTIALWAGAIAAGLVLGLAVALLLAAPVLDVLSRRVERLVRGEVVDRGAGLSWEVLQSLRAALYFLAAAPGVWVLGLVPFVGPPLAIAWAGFALAFQLTDPPLTRRGLDFRARLAWHRRYRVESLGFGLLGVVFLVVPLANLLIGPALAVGGTLLVLEFEEGLAVPAAAPVAEPPVAPPAAPASDAPTA